MSLRCAKQWFIPMAVILSYIVTLQWGIVLPDTGDPFQDPDGVYNCSSVVCIDYYCRPLVLIVGLVNKPLNPEEQTRRYHRFWRLQHLRNLLHWIMRSAVNRRILSKEAFSFPE